MSSPRGLGATPLIPPNTYFILTGLRIFFWPYFQSNFCDTVLWADFDVSKEPWDAFSKEPLGALSEQLLDAFS